MCSFDELHQFATDIPARRLENPPPGHQNQIDVVGKHAARKTERFAQQALGTRAIDGPAKGPLRSDDTNPTCCVPAPPVTQHEVATCMPSSGCEGLIEFRSLPDATRPPQA